MMTKKENRREKDFWGYGRAILMGGLTSLLTCLGLLLVGAAAIDRGVVPPGMEDRVAVAVGILSGLAGGWVGVWISPGGEFLLGPALGGALFLLELSLGMLLERDGTVSGDWPVHLCACLCGGAVGGLLAGRGRRTGRTVRRRKRG